MSKRKKICLVIPGLNAGGMERVMSELAKYFAQKESIDLHLVLYGKNPSVFYSLHENISIYKPSFVFNNRYRFWFTIKTIGFLRKQIKQIHPDTILSFGEYWNSFVLLALFGLKFPVFISDRCQPDKQYSQFHAFLRKWLYPKAAGIIAQTNVARDIYYKNFRNPHIEVIGNPIRKIEEAPVGEKENIILSAGRLINSKHHDRLIRIFSKLRAPGWKLIIIGGNALKQNNLELLNKLLKDLGLTDRVMLTGELPDIDDYYQKSKIFAFTSSSEGFPNVVGEALSARLPVVSYDCVAGPSEMITNGENGFLVPVFDDALFQEKLQLLIDNENLRQQMAEKAPESIKRFSIETIGEQFLNFILPHETH
jgi:glycosyltransferase involved in cell wall biosynthesis